MKNNIKHVFFDIDGTLLNSDLQLNIETINGIKRIMDKHVGVSIVTARMLKSVKGFFKKLNFDYICALNGSLIYNQNEAVIEQVYKIDKNVFGEILNELKTNNIVFNIFTKNDVFVSGFSKDSLNKKYQESMSPKIFSGSENLNDVCLVEVIFEEEDTLTLYKNKLQQQYDSHISVTDGGYNCLEITKKGIDKGRSLEYISEKLNINLEETVAIGDSETDISMIKKAGIGVAMKNSNKDLIKAADLVTYKNNDENGAIDFILDLL